MLTISWLPTRSTFSPGSAASSLSMAGFGGPTVTSPAQMTRSLSPTVCRHASQQCPAHPVDGPERAAERLDDVVVVEVRVRPDPGAGAVGGRQAAALVRLHPLQQRPRLPGDYLPACPRARQRGLQLVAVRDVELEPRPRAGVDDDARDPHGASRNAIWKIAASVTI